MKRYNDPIKAAEAQSRWRERNRDRWNVKQRLRRAVQRVSTFWTAIYTKKLAEMSTVPISWQSRY